MAITDKVGNPIDKWSYLVKWTSMISKLCTKQHEKLVSQKLLIELTGRRRAISLLTWNVAGWHSWTTFLFLSTYDIFVVQETWAQQRLIMNGFNVLYSWSSFLHLMPQLQMSSINVSVGWDYNTLYILYHFYLLPSPQGQVLSFVHYSKYQKSTFADLLSQMAQFKQLLIKWSSSRSHLPGWL